MLPKNWRLIAPFCMVLLSCNQSRRPAEIEFYDASITGMSACLIAGRDCGILGQDSGMQRSVEIKDECFAHIERVEMNISDTAALTLVCRVQNHLVELAASSERSSSPGGLSDPVITIRFP